MLWAAYYGRIETLKQAVKHGANITGPSRELAAKRRQNCIYTTLYVAIVADEYAMIQYLLDNGVDMHTPIFNVNGQLHPRAVVVDRPDTEFDANHGSDSEPTHTLENSNQYGGRYSAPEDSFIPLKSRKYSENTATGVEFPLLEALRQAAFNQNEQAAQLLIRRGAYLIKPGVSALDFYTNFGSSSSDLAGSDRIRKLLAKTPKIDASGVCVPEHEGTSQTDEEKSKLLRLLCGVDLKGSYIPPLSYAAWIARPDLVEVALMGFHDDTERNYRWNNTTALGLAVQSRDLTTIKLVLSRCLDLKPSFDLLVLAAKDENDEPFRSLYHHDVAGISERSDFGLIVEALSHPGKESLLKEVLDAANLTEDQLRKMSNHHHLALFSAAKNYHLDILELLLSYKAIASAAISLSPKTLIHHICTGKPVWEVTPIIGCLVRHGFPLVGNGRLDGTLPPVPYALLHGNVFAVLSLLKWGARVDTDPSAELSSLHYLVMNDKLEVSIIDTCQLINELKQRKASINRLSRIMDEPDYTGSYDSTWALRFQTYQATPLFFAVLNGTHMALIMKLLDSGASAKSTIIYKKSPMCLIAGLITKEFVAKEAAGGVFSALMKHGARLDDRCGRDWGSALDRACYVSESHRVRLGLWQRRPKALEELAAVCQQEGCQPGACSTPFTQLSH